MVRGGKGSPGGTHGGSQPQFRAPGPRGVLQWGCVDPPRARSGAVPPRAPAGAGDAPCHPGQAGHSPPPKTWAASTGRETFFWGGWGIGFVFPSPPPPPPTGVFNITPRPSSSTRHGRGSLRRNRHCEFAICIKTLINLTQPRWHLKYYVRDQFQPHFSLEGVH